MLFQQLTSQGSRKTGALFFYNTAVKSPPEHYIRRRREKFLVFGAHIAFCYYERSDATASFTKQQTGIELVLAVVRRAVAGPVPRYP